MKYLIFKEAWVRLYSSVREIDPELADELLKDIAYYGVLKEHCTDNELARVLVESFDFQIIDQEELDDLNDC